MEAQSRAVRRNRVWVLIYDDRCGFCRRSVRLIRWLDWLKQYRYHGSSDPAILAAARLTPEEAATEIKLWNGERMWGGYDALAEVSKRLPLVCWLAPVLLLSPVRILGRKWYRWIARRRHCLWPAA